MISATVLSGLLLLAAGWTQADPASPVAAGPKTVHPLLPGMQAPDVSLRNVQGEPVSLASFIAKKPTVLIFYRGGW